MNIINLYLFRQVLGGAALALLVLSGLNLLLMFLGEMDDVGEGAYTAFLALQYTGYRLPASVVAFLPISVFLGSLLSLGNLASRSEIVVMQAAGMSVWKILQSVLMVAFLLSVVALMTDQWVVPPNVQKAEIMKTVAQQSSPLLQGREGIWLKDENRVIQIQELQSGGQARGVQIFEFAEDFRTLNRILWADTARPLGQQWRFHDVRITDMQQIPLRVESFESLDYEGQLQLDVVGSLILEPGQMSMTDLYGYTRYLKQNSIDAYPEELVLWQKLYMPLSVIVMSIVAMPFALSHSRQGAAGKRLMIGILIGISFIVFSDLSAMLATHLRIWPFLNALLPIIGFALLAWWQMQRSARI